MTSEQWRIENFHTSRAFDKAVSTDKALADAKRHIAEAGEQLASCVGWGTLALESAQDSLLAAHAAITILIQAGNAAVAQVKAARS